MTIKKLRFSPHLLRLQARAQFILAALRLRKFTERLVPSIAVFLVDVCGLLRFGAYRKAARTVLRKQLALAGPYLDESFYLAQIDNLRYRRAAALDPLLHFLVSGWFQGLKPNPGFDPVTYKERVRGVPWTSNPLLHFAKANEGLPPDVAITQLQRQAVTSRYASTDAIKADPLESDFANQRIAIYTAVISGYDELKGPAVPLPNCDLYVFSDGPIDAPPGWTVLPQDFAHDDPSRRARFIKLHPHLYFQNYDVSIWLDANITIEKDIRPFLDVLKNGAYCASFIHPARDCIYDEGRECVVLRKDAPATVLEQLDRYRREGHPHHAGLWETNVLVRRHNDPRCIELMTTWWRELELGSKRDQLSLPVVARRLGASVVPLDHAGVDARRHPLLALSPHRNARELSNH